MELALVASHLHLRSESSALLGLLRRCEPDIRDLNLGLHAVGHTYDAIVGNGVLSDYPRLQRYANDRYSGLVRMTAAIVGGGAGILDGVIYLATPDDASTLLPETLALKRQCLIHSKPFLSTVASVIDWIGTEHLLAGHPSRPNAASSNNIMSSQTLALIAHDGMKQSMMALAGEYFELLSRFSRRVSTGTTGRRLNELARERGWPSDVAWTSCYESGPLGGDVQIANLILLHQCQRVIFFCDPLVAHQHEVDIRLLERAIAANGDETTYLACPVLALRWAEAAQRVMYDTNYQGVNKQTFTSVKFHPPNTS